MTHRIQLLLARSLIVLVAVLNSPVRGQQADELTPQFAERRGRTSPIMVPKSERPTAAVEQLAFSGPANDLKLLAAGRDKVVRCWRIAGGAGNNLDPQYQGETVWPIYRDLRGVILALDATHQGGRHRLAFGGFGAVASQVNLAVLASNEPAEALVADLRRQVVQDIAFSPDGTTLAVGHEGEPGQLANYYLWDLQANPRRKLTVPTRLLQVRYLSFSPDGSQIAAAGLTQAKQAGGASPGLVQVWRLERQAGRLVAPVEQSRHELQPTEQREIIRGLDWLDERNWVAGTVCGLTNAAHIKGVYHDHSGKASTHAGNGCVLVNNTSRPLVVESEQNNGSWQKRAPIAAGQSATAQPGRFRPLNAQGEPQADHAVLLPAGFKYEYTPYVTAISRVGTLSARPTPLVVAALWDYLANEGEKYWVEIQDQAFKTKLRLENSRFVGTVAAVAASPDGQFVAAAGPAELQQFGGAQVIQIRVWSARTGRLLATIPDDSKADNLALASAVSPIASLEITDEQGKPHSVVYGTGLVAPGQAPPPLSRRFELGENRRRIHRLEQPRRLPPDNDWRIERTDGGRKFNVQGQGRYADRTYGPFDLDANAPYCAVPFGMRVTENGRVVTRTYIAVGYDNGVRVWAQHPQRREYRVARSFYGHTGPATCIALSPDRKWLASGSTDGTISAWSLVGLDAGNELGITAARQGQNELRVTNVAAGGIGHEAGFQPGMVITRVLEAGVEVSANQMAAKLASPTPGRELFLHARLDGQALTVQTPVSHDPVWTLYTFVDNKCIVATPQGYFDALVTDFNRSVLSRVQWHVNRGGGWGGRDRAQGAIRFSADMYKNQFLDNKLVADAIATGTPALIAGAAEQFPILPAINFVGRTQVGHKFIRERGLPEVILDEHLPLAVSLRVSGAPKKELWVNGRRLTNTDQNSAGEFLITSEHLREGRNHLIGVAVIEIGAKKFSSREDLPLVYRAGDAGPQPRLFYLGVGVTQLQNAAALAAVLTPLDHADNDARRLGEALENAIAKGGGAGLTLERSRLLIAEKATKQAILNELDVMASQVRPNDVAVILLAGHGTHVDPFAAAGPAQAEGFFYVAYDTGQNFVATSVSGAELDEKLSRFPCRTALLLDTCHSQAAGSQRQLIDRAGLEIGPLVLSACETAQESRDFGGIDHDGKAGHGAFTAAVLEALTGKVTPKARNQSRKINADNNGDQLLSLLELCQYCRDRTPQLVRELPGGRGLQQNPVVMTSLTFDPDQIILCRAP